MPYCDSDDSSVHLYDIPEFPGYEQLHVRQSVAVAHYQYISSSETSCDSYSEVDSEEEESVSERNFGEEEVALSETRISEGEEASESNDIDEDSQSKLDSIEEHGPYQENPYSETYSNKEEEEGEEEAGPSHSYIGISSATTNRPLTTAPHIRDWNEHVIAANRPKTGIGNKDRQVLGNLPASSGRLNYSEKDTREKRCALLKDIVKDPRRRNERAEAYRTLEASAVSAPS